MIQRRFTHCLILILLVIVLCACEEKFLTPSNILPGQAFPILALTDLQGKDTTIDNSSGKARVINIWATWCGACRHELPSLQRLKSKLDETKFDVIGISVDDDVYLVREYLIEQKISYANFLDADMSIANNIFGIRVYPSTYLVGSDGIIQDVIQGWREWDSPELVTKIRNLYKH